MYFLFFDCDEIMMIMAANNLILPSGWISLLCFYKFALEMISLPHLMASAAFVVLLRLYA